MMSTISNQDCAFHPKDDSQYVQNLLDKGVVEITYETFHISRPIHFKGPSTFRCCDIFFAQSLMNSGDSWHLNVATPATKRFFQCNVAFGQELYFYDQQGKFSFVRSLDD